METITKYSDTYDQVGIYKFFRYMNVYKYEHINLNSYNVYYNTLLQ